MELSLVKARFTYS